MRNPKEMKLNKQGTTEISTPLRAQKQLLGYFKAFTFFFKKSSQFCTTEKKTKESPLGLKIFCFHSQKQLQKTKVFMHLSQLKHQKNAKRQPFSDFSNE